MTVLFIDTDYKKFLEIYNGDEEKFTSTTETLLEEIEAKTKELVGKLIFALYSKIWIYICPRLFPGWTIFLFVLFCFYNFFSLLSQENNSSLGLP